MSGFKGWHKQGLINRINKLHDSAALADLEPKDVRVLDSLLVKIHESCLVYHSFLVSSRDLVEGFFPCTAFQTLTDMQLKKSVVSASFSVV